MKRGDKPIGLPQQHLNNFDFKKSSEIFEGIYKSKFWAHGDGFGSDSRPEIVEGFFEILDQIFETHDIETMSDFGCGSHYVFKDYKWPDNLKYTGYDASSIAIERAKNNCNREDFNFEVMWDFHDLEPSDFLILKDVTCHWSMDVVKEFLQDCAPKFKYVAIIGAERITRHPIIDEACEDIFMFKSGKGHPYGVWFINNDTEQDA